MVKNLIMAITAIIFTACPLQVFAEEAAGNTPVVQAAAETAAQPMTGTAEANPSAAAAADMPEAAALLAEAGVDTGCGGLLYSSVDMWGNYGVKRRINEVEEAVKDEELKKLLCADKKGAEFCGASDIKLVFSTVFNVLAAGSAAYCIIASGFFDSGRFSTDRAAELLVSAACVPVFVMTAEWFDAEAFNDRSRAMDVYNTNRSCGTAEQAQ